MSDGDHPTRFGVPRGRAAWTAAAERLVHDNRFTIAVVFPLVGAVTLVASARGLLPPALAFNPFLVLFGTLVMRLPLVVGLLPLVDRRAAGVLTALTGFVYAIEYVGVTTGWPYGAFEYGVSLGPMLFDTLPVALPVFYVPLVVNAYLLALLLLGRAADRRWLRVLAALAVLLAVDLVLDPGAVALGFWTYASGSYYGVPLSNYLGWALSGTVSLAALDLAFPHAAVRRRLAGCEFMLDDFVSFTLLWGGINLLYGQFAAALVAAALAGGLAYTDRFDVPFGPLARLTR